MDVEEEEKMIEILAKPVSHALFVDPAKTSEFLHHKTNPEVKARILRNAERLKEQMERSEIHEEIRESDKHQ